MEVRVTSRAAPESVQDALTLPVDSYEDAEAVAEELRTLLRRHLELAELSGLHNPSWQPGERAPARRQLGLLRHALEREW